MSKLNDLKSAIDNLLDISAARRILQLNANTQERAYEAYVFALCCQAVKNLGGIVEIYGIQSGLNPSVYVFRGGPGSMSSTSQDFCYARCILQSKQFEIHVDIEYIGQSGASHEIDVSFYDANRADEVRQSRQSPKTNANLIIAIECKFYESTPGVSLARTFIGLISDCSTNQVEAFVSNKSANNINLFLAKKTAPEPFTDLSPLDKDTEERFVRYFEHRLKKWSGGR